MKVTSWTYGGNKQPEFSTGSIYLVSEPIRLWFIHWVLWSGPISWAIRLGYYFPLPSFFYLTDSDSKEKVSWYDYYGTVGDLINVFVFMPAYQWYWKHPSRKQFSIDVGYNKLKKMFNEHNPQYFQDEENE